MRHVDTITEPVGLRAVFCYGKACKSVRLGAIHIRVNVSGYSAFHIKQHVLHQDHVSARRKCKKKKKQHFAGQ